MNRIWAKFMGRGFIEPLDKIATSRGIRNADWLSRYLINNGYNPKHTMSLRLHRAHTGYLGEHPRGRKEKYVFTGRVRRMNAEQFLDAIAAVTGAWQENPQFECRRNRSRKTNLPSAANPRSAGAVNLLTRAMGRPNREQVTSRRQSVATASRPSTDQRADPGELLDRGAAGLVATPPTSVADFTNTL